MPRTKKIHQLKIPVWLRFHTLLLLLSNSRVASAAGLVEMESLQFIARDDSACSEQDILPAKMGGKGDGAFISQSVRSGRDVDTNVR